MSSPARRTVAGDRGEFVTTTPGCDVHIRFRWHLTGDQLRLTDIEFDSKTLRVIAEADGIARVTVTSWPTRG